MSSTIAGGNPTSPPDVAGMVYVTADNTGDYTSLSAAITAEGNNKIYKLGPGDFTLTSQLALTNSNIVIEGSGVDVTRIVFDMGTTGAGFKITGSIGSAFDVTPNVAKHSHTITLASTTGLVAGDWIYLTRDVVVDANTADRYDAEIHKILTVDNSTQITIEDVTYEVYNTADNANLYKITWAKSVAIKNLTFIDNRSSVTAITEQADTLFLFCYGLILENVKFDQMVHACCGVQNCFNSTFNNIGFDGPRQIDEPGGTGIRYGLYLLSASTNFTLNGAWAQRCRHSFTTNTIAGQTYGAGRRRNITINGFVSYNADTANFDTHESDIGITFNGCGAQSAYFGSDTTDSKGFNTRSPTTFNACWVENCQAYGFVIFNNDDSAGTDTSPGGDRTSLVNCRINNVVQAGGVGRGVRIENNRASILIQGCQFYNVPDDVIRIETPGSNFIIANNMFHSCGADLTINGGLIMSPSGTVSDLIIQGNIFGAGTPPANARPLFITTTANRLLFTNNDVNGLTNTSPSIGAASTDCRVENNLGLNPIGKITNPTHSGNVTLGFYGGDVATVSSGKTYKIVGGDMMVTLSSGGGNSISILDSGGSVLISGITPELKSQLILHGYSVKFGSTSGQTLIVCAK